eukprot:5411340-Prymnesium_polylepis.1
MQRLGTRKTLEGFLDLGGATLDLAGGTFLLTRPITFPGGYANYRIEGGTLVAAGKFPERQYMLAIGDDSCASRGSKL